MKSRSIAKFCFLSSVAIFALGLAVVSVPSIAVAEDCTGTLPGGNCTLDENTTAPLTIDNGVVLSVDGNVTIGHTIDGDDADADGTVEAVGLGNSVVQSADIGSNFAIGAFNLLDDTTWTTSALIRTSGVGTTIDLSADAGETLNFISGGGYTGNIDGHAGDIVNFGSDGNGGSFLTGGQIGTVGVVHTSGDLTVINSMNNIATLSVLSGANMVMNSSITALGALDVDGRVTIGSSNTLSAGSYTVDAQAADFTMMLSRTDGVTSNATLSVPGINLGADTMRIQIADDSEVLPTATIASLISGGGVAPTAPGTFVDSSYLYDYALVANGNNFDLQVTRGDVDTLSVNQNNSNIANVFINDLSTSTDPSIKQIQSLLGNDINSESFNERLESLSPTVDGSFVRIVSFASDQMRKITTHNVIHNRDQVSSVASRSNISESRSSNRLSSRFSSRRSGGQVLSAGGKDLESGRRVKSKGIRERNTRTVEHGKGKIWAQLYAQTGTQDFKDGIDGYDLSSSGVMIGVDTGTVHEDLIVGMAVLGGTAQAEAENANATETSSDVYGLSVYGGRNFSSDVILSGSATYMHSNNETIRHNVAGIQNNNAKAEFAVEQLSLNASLSKRLKMFNSVRVMPRVFSTYELTVFDEYNEGGVNAVALSVDYNTLHRYALGIGADVQKTYTTHAGSQITPFGSLEYSYDLMHDRMGGDASFSAGSFSIEGPEPQKSVLNAGLGLNVQTGEHLAFEAGYNLELRDSQTLHSGTVKMAYDF